MGNNERTEQSVIDSDIDYTYKVIDAVVEAMDRVGAKPELASAFTIDLLTKMPELVDALLTITLPEHRPKMAELVRSSARMMGSWTKATQK